MFGASLIRSVGRVVGLVLCIAVFACSALRADGPAPFEKPADTGKTPELVTAKAYLAADKLVPGKTCRVVMLLDIKQGWHVNANPPSSENLIPTQFTVKSALGSKLKDVQYPKGHVIKVQGQQVSVYEKQVKIYGTVEVPANATGAEELQLQIRYQACNDNTCLVPKTITLKGNLPIARPGEQVKQINAELFSANASRKS